MLFARKLLAPGPQPKHPGNVNPVLDTGPPAEPGLYLNQIKKNINHRARRDRRKLKFQTPSTKFQISSTRTKSKTKTYEFGHRILIFENYLEFGNWVLIFSSACSAVSVVYFLIRLEEISHFWLNEPRKERAYGPTG
jgi:hypothetical protein